MEGDILSSREKLSNLVKELSMDGAVLSIHSNIPGPYKSVKEAYLILGVFTRILSKNTPIKEYHIESSDGPVNVQILTNSKYLKEECMSLEETHPLGRFVDLDVVINGDVETRKELRKCYLCDKPAFVCSKEHNHTYSDLLKYVREHAKEYLRDRVLSNLYEAITDEIDLDPKFGLVTPKSSGSHKDMDYKTMYLARDAIIPYLLEMFDVGFSRDDLKEIFNSIRQIGLVAEAKMYEDTGGINAYKGLIFDLGLICASIGYKISRNTKDSIYEIVSKMCDGILDEFNSCENTFGIEAYKKYKIGGARKEAASGFKSIQSVINDLDLNDKSTWTMVLAKLISISDDTILLKRCGSLEKYIEVKQMFKDFNGDIDEMTAYCIKNNLSFGGSADLLAVSLFIKLMENEFDLNKNNIEEISL